MMLMLAVIKLVCFLLSQNSSKEQFFKNLTKDLATVTAL